jgi:hypothetical protein
MWHHPTIPLQQITAKFTTFCPNLWNLTEESGADRLVLAFTTHDIFVHFTITEALIYAKCGNFQGLDLLIIQSNGL